MEHRQWNTNQLVSKCDNFNRAFVSGLLSSAQLILHVDVTGLMLIFHANANSELPVSARNFLMKVLRSLLRAYIPAACWTKMKFVAIQINTKMEMLLALHFCKHDQLTSSINRDVRDTWTRRMLFSSLVSILGY